METKIHYLLVLFIGGSLYGMDVPPLVKESSPFHIEEMQREIARWIFRLLPKKEAIKTFNWMMLTDKKALSLKEATCTLFLKQFLNEKLHHSLEQIITPSQGYRLSKMLYGEETDIPALFNSFIETLKACAKKQDWKEALTSLEQLKSKGLKEYFECYFVQDSYLGSPAKKTVLICALELGAPTELIKALIDAGCRLTELPLETPPPLLVVAIKMMDLNNLECWFILNERLKIPISDIEGKGNSSLENLQELIKLLMTSGAKATDTFSMPDQQNPAFRAISPLLLTICLKDLKTRELLLTEKKILCSLECMTAASTFIFDPSAEREEFLKRLLGVCEDIQTPFALVNSSITWFKDVPNGVESIIKVLSFFIDHGADLKAPSAQGGNILDVAYEQKWNQGIINLLIQKGAIKSSGLSDEVRKQNEFSRDANGIMLRIMKDEPVSKEEICAVLKDAKAMIISSTAALKLDTASNEVWGTVIMPFFIMSMYVPSSQEACDFLSFIATHRPLAFNYRNYGLVTSLFDLLVASFKTLKIVSLSEEEYRLEIEAKARGFGVLLYNLSKNGIRPDQTTVQKAYELGMPEIAGFMSMDLDELARYTT